MGLPPAPPPSQLAAEANGGSQAHRETFVLVSNRRGLGTELPFGCRGDWGHLSSCLFSQRGFHGDYHARRGNPGKRAPASMEYLLCARLKTDASQWDSQHTHEDQTPLTEGSERANLSPVVTQQASGELGGGAVTTLRLFLLCLNEAFSRKQF